MKVTFELGMLFQAKFAASIWRIFINNNNKFVKGRKLDFCRMSKSPLECPNIRLKAISWPYADPNYSTWLRAVPE